MERGLASEHSYPSPTSAQVNAGSGPFFGQNGGDQQLPHDLSQLQAASDPGRNHHEHQEHDPNQTSAEDYSIQAEANAADDALRAHQHETLAQHVMNMSAPQAHGGEHPGEDSAARAKRSKVSRACDECRRKKIRCDASETDQTMPCSNCKRTSAACRFSRTPMKRGPSKGYIKELADKINTLESRLGPTYGNAMADQGYGGQYANEFSMHDPEQRNDYAQPTADMGRKRTHSMSERGGLPYADSPYAPARQSANAWGQDGPRQLPPLSQSMSGIRNPQTPGAEGGPGSRQQFSPRAEGGWRYGASDNARRESAGVSYDNERDSAAAALLEWDEPVVDEYEHE